jgi:hypothetical protein
MTQKLYIAEEQLINRPDVIQHVTNLKAQNPKFTLLDIGASHNPFNQEFLTHTFDLRPSALNNVHGFLGNLNDAEDWKQLFDYTEEHGKFSFCNCTHTLEDIADPMVALKYMPMIADEGFIAVPSKYYELNRRESFRGAIHHRWIWNNNNNKLVGYPKINLIEYINYGDFETVINRDWKTELRMFWKDDIDYSLINNDYLGPTREAVIDMYVNLIY